ncbi:MAG TPA: hypothetical protein VGB77_22500 [Abditibacteriaceae bacterium]|jgi:hypothetical protein
MQSKKRFHAREFLLLTVPVLLFVIWALFTNEQDVRSNIKGKWRSKQGNILEMHVTGNKLIVLKNGSEDNNFKFRFVSDNHIEVTDMTRSKKLVYVMDVRIWRSQLQFGNFAENKTAESSERVLP